MTCILMQPDCAPTAPRWQNTWQRRLTVGDVGGARGRLRKRAADDRDWRHMPVLHETGGRTGGFFVEFGAADGVSLSTTYLLERDYNWQGIVAEANPVWHAALKRNRQAAIDLRCVFTTTGARVKFAAT